MEDEPSVRPDDASEEVETVRPSLKSAAASPTALGNLIATFALLGCFFLPHSVGCNDRSMRPISISVGILRESSEAEEFLVLAVLWPFALAACTFAVFVVLVVLRPPWYDRALLGLPLGSAIVLTVCWVLLLFAGADSSRVAMTIAVFATPLAMCVGARMWWLCRRGEITAAATWGHGMLCVLAAFSLRWFWYPPITRMLWGGYLAIAAALMMMVASWMWTTRARYDLHDRGVAPQPFQVSLRQIVIAIALTAVALTYWRILGTR